MDGSISEAPRPAADDPPMDPPVPPGAAIVMIVADAAEYLDGLPPTYADSDYVPPAKVFNGREED